MTTPHTETSLKDQGWKQRSLPGFIGIAGPLWTRREGESWAYGLLAGGQHLNPAQVVHGTGTTGLMNLQMPLRIGCSSK